MDSQEYMIKLILNGHEIQAPNGYSVIQAAWYSGMAQVKNVGCLEGVCGSCRVMIWRRCTGKVTVELGCQVWVEDDMRVIFLPKSQAPHKYYHLDDLDNQVKINRTFLEVFPETLSCRHCGGCNASCPAQIDVEQAVCLAGELRLHEVGEHFLNCVGCGLCDDACPEKIYPQFVGYFARRATARSRPLPHTLQERISEIHQNKLRIEF